MSWLAKNAGLRESAARRFFVEAMRQSLYRARLPQIIFPAFLPKIRS
jgi:hypothetical protein